MEVSVSQGGRLGREMSGVLGNCSLPMVRPSVLSSNASPMIRLLML